MNDTGSGSVADLVPRVAVVGAGTMGYGIAVAFAVGGSSVRLHDVDEGQLADARRNAAGAIKMLAAHDEGDVRPDDAGTIRSRIEYDTTLPTAVADASLVIEAVPESLELKRQVFGEVEGHAPADAILATNTSSLPLAAIGEAVDRPGRFLGTHWFNPPHIVPVVEVVRTEGTTDATVRTVRDALERIGKSPVTVERPVPGYIGNRIQSAMANEAWALLEAGIASAEDIDTAVKGTFGFRLPVMGVFEKGDHSGLDIHHRVLEELLPEIDRGTDPPSVLSSLVEAGDLGTKTGAGVYDWSETDLEAINRERDRHLLSLLAVYRGAKSDTGDSTDRFDPGEGDGPQ